MGKRKFDKVIVKVIIKEVVINVDKKLFATGVRDVVAKFILLIEKEANKGIPSQASLHEYHVKIFHIGKVIICSSPGLMAKYL